MSAAELTAVVRNPDVNVYAEPTLESPKVTKLERDATVTIAAQHGLWYELKLPDGKTGFARVNDVRVNYGKIEDSGANVRVLTTGKAGEGRVSETAGVRGIEESDLKSASFIQAQLDAMTAHRVDAQAAANAGEHHWKETRVAWEGEAKPRKDKASSGSGSTADASGTLQSVSGMMGSLGQKARSVLGTANKVASKPESQLSAEELALGPQIAGRVLGARRNEPDGAIRGAPENGCSRNRVCALRTALQDPPAARRQAGPH